MFSVLISVVVLIIAGALLIALLYKDPITRQKLAVEETQSPDQKSQLIQKLRTSNGFVISQFEKALAGIKNAFGGKEPETDYDRHHKARLIWRLVAVGIILDWLIQWMVNQRMPVLSPLGWLIPSLLVALLISWFTDLAAFSLTSDPARPARGERICRDAMIVTGILSVAGMLLFLYGRTVSAASVNDWLIAIISGSLWVVAEGLGVSCGFAAAWARHVDRAGLASKEFHQIEQKLQVHYEFREWLEEKDAKPKIKVASMVLLIILTMFLPTHGFAQVVNRPDLTILIDGTASVDQIRLGDALVKLRESAPILAGKYGRIKVGVFSDEGPFTKLSEISVLPAISAKDCSKPTSSNKTFRADLTIMFPGISEYQGMRNTKQCLATNSSVEQKNRDNLAAAVGRIRATIPESIHPKSGCTGIAGLLRFVLSTHSQSGATFLLITDGEETCRTDAISGIHIPSDSKVILFLVPKVGLIEIEGPEAIKRGETWQTAIPGLAVRPYTNIFEIAKMP